MIRESTQRGPGLPALSLASFVLGLGVGGVLWLNAALVRRKLVSMALTGGDSAVALGKHVHRVSARVMEDMQDAYAEVQSERAREAAATASTAATLGDLRSIVQQLRGEIDSLRSDVQSSQAKVDNRPSPRS